MGGQSAQATPDRPVITASHRVDLIQAVQQFGGAGAGQIHQRGDAEHRPFAIAVLRITGGRIAEITAFHDPGLFPAFGLPGAPSPAHR
jgi:RNA polymerase sigma-70 factor, ECF subfamily